MDNQFEFISDVPFFRDLDNIHRTEMFVTHILPYFHIAEYQLQKKLGAGPIDKKQLGHLRVAALKRVNPIIKDNGIERVWNAALACASPFRTVDAKPGTLCFICSFFLQTPLVSNSPIGMECLDQFTKPSWFTPNLKPETREFLINLVAIGFYLRLGEPEAVASFNFRYEYFDLTKFILPRYIGHYFSVIKNENEFVLKNAKEKPELYVSIAINPNRRKELVYRLVYFQHLYRISSLKNQKSLNHEGLSSLFYFEQHGQFASQIEFWTMLHTDRVRKDAAFKFVLQKGEVNVLLNELKDYFIHSKSGNSNPLSSLLDPIKFLYADGKRVSLKLMRANDKTGNPSFNLIVSKAFELPFDAVNQELEKIGHPVRKQIEVE